MPGTCGRMTLTSQNHSDSHITSIHTVPILIEFGHKQIYLGKVALPPPNLLTHPHPLLRSYTDFLTCFISCNVSDYFSHLPLV